MAKWIKSTYHGVRYREHATRTTGVGRNKRPLRYISIFSKLDGKMVEEAIGWESSTLNEKIAAAILAELTENRRKGSGPKTLKERRALQAAAEEQATQLATEEVRRNTTFVEIFVDHYFPHAKQNRRSAATIEREENLFRLWIAPVIGSKPLKDIAPLNLEKIKKDMTKAGKAARSIQYALAVIRQVFNYALANDIYTGKNPADKSGGVKRPKVDNRRTRYLTRQEASDLLEELGRRSPQVRDIALLSLHTGCRAGEALNLRWQDIDLKGGTALLVDTKSSKNRAIYFTDEVKAMLTGRRQGGPNEFVFQTDSGEKIPRVSNSFIRAVEKLGLNEGIVDPRQKVTFHTLRHSFASWLAEDGVDLYHIKELLGHSTITLTERYSHLSDSVLKQAALRIQKS